MRPEPKLADYDRFLAMVARLQEKADRAGYRGLPDDIEEYPAADRAAAAADRRHQFERE